MKKNFKKQRKSAHGRFQNTRRHEKASIKRPRDGKQLSGVFTSSGRGYGFVRPETLSELTNGDDIFIPAHSVHGAESGDFVRVLLRPSHSLNDAHKTEGEIIEIEKRANMPVIGTLESSPITVRRGGKQVLRRSFLFFADDASRLSFPVRISEAKAHGAGPGERAAIKLLAYPEYKKEAVGEVIERFGNGDDPQSSIRALIYENGAPTVFSEDALAEAERVSALVKPDPTGRLDLREKTVFTIDSEYARDLDDAISVEATDSGWLLGVHIADVSEYVAENGHLDLEARSRGNSIYYPGAVIPMLPEALSNGCCSLNRESEKLTLSALISLDRSGSIKHCRFCESIISSSARGVYSELNAVLDGSAAAEIMNKYPENVLASLREGVRLYRVLEARSKSRGCFELAESDAVIKLDRDGMPTEIAREVRGITERMIEQFMICANEAAARVTSALALPGIYRIHEPPDPEKISAFLDFVGRLGIDVRTAGIRPESLGGRNIARLLELAEEKGCAPIVSRLLLRSLMKAKYDTEARGHFGLALEYYSHFTSPIRRYSDLALHRELKRALKRGVSLELSDPENITPHTISSPLTSAACVSANEGENRALNIERTADDIYKSVYMSRFIGDEFDTTVSSVASFGIFVELENTCEGLIPASSFDDYIDFDKDRMRFVCYGTEYTPGMKVKAVLTAADTVRGKLTFELADDRHKV